jgi:hypothetical protein
LLGVLHHDHGADHDDHGGIDVSSAHRAQQHHLDQRAEKAAGHDRDQQRKKEIEAEQDGDEVDEIGAERVKLAMGEIHDPHDPEDQGQADAEQRIGAAEDQHVDHVLEEFGHLSLVQI